LKNTEILLAQKNETRPEGRVLRPEGRIPAKRRFASDRADIGRLQAFGAGFDFKLHALIFSESPEALGFDFAEMRKKVVAALLRGDKAKALGVVEPFDGTGLSAHLVFL
jgi:hypothetical protein